MVADTVEFNREGAREARGVQRVEQRQSLVLMMVPFNQRREMKAAQISWKEGGLVECGGAT